MSIQSIIQLFLQAFLSFPLNPLFWLLLLLVATQYRRIAQNDSKLLGRPRYVLWRVLLSSVAFGMLGGLVAGILLFIMGISLLEIGIYFVWPLALLLLLIHPRYLCFAYAGGLVGAFAAVVQAAGSVWPLFSQGIFNAIYQIHIPGLLALIGALHLSESVLIALSGHLYASPVYLKTERGIIGGFMLQKFWPLPFVGIMAQVISQTTAESMSGTEMPGWWPLFASRLAVGSGAVLMYYMMPIVAGLGYGDLAISTKPQTKRRQSAVNLALYSLLVLALALLAERLPVLTFFAALFVPFGHEYLIMQGSKKELAQPPLYEAPDHGVRVLDLFDDSPAKAAGIYADDIITHLNGNPVFDLHSYYILLRTTWRPLQMLVKRNNSDRLFIIDCGEDPGIIPVPDYHVTSYILLRHENFWDALKNKVKKLLRRNHI